MSKLTPAERDRLKGYYVRMRYNDRPMYVPGCKPKGKHYGDDESLCTLAEFKAIADAFTPRNWKVECQRNMDEEAVRPVGREEWAGYADGSEPGTA